MKAPTWLNLRRIGNSYPSRLSIFMPILGYAILFQSPALTAISNVDAIFGTPEPIGKLSLNMIFLYYGLFVFGVGSGIFYIFCPNSIRIYDDKNAFIESSLDKLASGDITKYLDEIEKYHVDMEIRKQARFHREAIKSGIPSGNNTQIRIFALSNLYDKLEIDYYIARYISFLCYMLGITLICIPSLVVMWRVTRKVLGQ